MYDIFELPNKITRLEKQIKDANDETKLNQYKAKLSNLKQQLVNINTYNKNFSKASKFITQSDIDLFKEMLSKVDDSATTDFQYCEFDSNQSAFEYISNNADIVFTANTKTDSATLAIITKYLITNYAYGKYFEFKDSTADFDTLEDYLDYVSENHMSNNVEPQGIYGSYPKGYHQRVKAIRDKLGDSDKRITKASLLKYLST
jgi:hypothetical protein